MPRDMPAHRRPPRGRKSPPGGGDPLSRGRDALARCDWSAARDLLLETTAGSDHAEALEGLGWAFHYLDDEEHMFDARERAYRVYLERGDHRSAARVAMWLAFDYAEFRGDRAVASGLFQRARELLAGVEVSAEHAWLAIIEAHEVLLGEKDPTRAAALATDALRIALEAGSRDLAVMARAVEGLARVTAGHIDEGMRRLDAAVAAAVGGEMQDINAIGPVCCYIIHACERVRDYERASQWCERLKELTTRWSSQALLGTCRVQYAGVLMSRGEWRAAEAELTAGRDLLARVRPGLARGALPRLAELRRRQGDWEEAAVLFRRVEHTPLGQLGLAELAYDQQDFAGAADLAERYLRRFAADNQLERAPGLDLLARTRIAQHDDRAAAALVAEIQGIATLVGTPPLAASAALTAGLLELARGAFGDARRRFEDAVDLFSRSGCPFEAGCARLELARALEALGRPAPARAEALGARQALAHLGACRLVERIDAFLDGLTPAPTAGAKGERRATLTAREVEVLRLVARGLSDKEIAARLSLSPHTIHRHVSNILLKLEQPSRAAAVALATRQALM